MRRKRSESGHRSFLAHRYRERLFFNAIKKRIHDDNDDEGNDENERKKKKKNCASEDNRPWSE